MPKKPQTTSIQDPAIPVLVVMPLEEDHKTLHAILPRSKWTLQKADTFSSAVEQLKNQRIPLVLCEKDLRSGSWKQLLQTMRDMNEPPFMIIASRFADEQLWAEALNL